MKKLFKLNVVDNKVLMVEDLNYGDLTTISRFSSVYQFESRSNDHHKGFLQFDLFVDIFPAMEQAENVEIPG